jgi:hypothetical protein
VVKYCGAGQTPDDNMARVHCMLDTEGYKYTLRVCNTFLLSHCNKNYTNARRCYLIRTLPVLLNCDGEEEEELILFCNFIKKLFLCVLMSECRGSFPDHTSRARPFRYSYMVEFLSRL